MNLFKLAKLFTLKYKVASSITEVENDVRQGIDMLWRFANKDFNILRVCADADASKPKNANEKKSSCRTFILQRIIVKN